MAKKKGKPKKKNTRTYRVELTAMSMILWGFCLFFLLSWVFILGIMVGRGFMPGAVTALTDLKGQIRNLQEMISRGEEEESRPKKDYDLEPKLAFYDKLSSKKEEASHKQEKKRSHEAPQKSPADKPPQLSGTKPGAGSEKGGDVPEKKIIGQSGGPTQFTVQIASLEDKKKAIEIVKNLSDKGYPAYYYPVKIKGRNFYRVRCRKFQTREQAQRFAKLLEKKEGIKGYATKAE